MSDEDRKHHPTSPSTLQNIEACPVYQGKQDQVPNERAVAGSKAHAVTESGNDDLTLDDEDAVAVADCLDFYERRKQLMIEARERAINAGANNLFKMAGNQKPFRECVEVISQALDTVIEQAELHVRVDDEKVELPIYNPETRKWELHTVPCTTSGYFDKLLIDHTGEYAELFDWKFGMWPVEKAENNVQGIAYALGLFKKLPELKMIRVYFKQPHLDYVTNVDITREIVPHLYLRIKTIVQRAAEARRKAMAGDWSSAKPMDPICTFCTHIGHCPKVAEFACNVAKKFYPLEIPENITPSMALDPKESSLAMRLARVMKVWADAFKRQTADRVLRGDAPLPEGYQLQHRTGNREVVDVQGFRAEALKRVTEEELATATRYAIGEVEKLIKDKAPRGQKKNEVNAFKEAIEASGCVAKGDPYSFLRATASTEKE